MLIGKYWSENVCWGKTSFKAKNFKYKQGLQNKSFKAQFGHVFARKLLIGKGKMDLNVDSKVG